MRKYLWQSGHGTITAVSRAGDPKCVRTGFTNCLQLTLSSTAILIHTSTSQGSRVPPSCRSARSMEEAVCNCVRKHNLRHLTLLSTVAIESSARICAVSFTATFATMTFHSFACPPHLHPFEALGVSHTATVATSHYCKGGASPGAWQPHSSCTSG